MSLVKFNCDNCRLKYYKFDNDTSILCKNCSKKENNIAKRSFTLSHNKYSNNDVELLDYISDNFYDICCRVEDISLLEEKNKNLERKCEALEEQIKELRISHDSIMDMFRSYSNQK